LYLAFNATKWLNAKETGCAMLLVRKLTSSGVFDSSLL